MDKGDVPTLLGLFSFLFVLMFLGVAVDWKICIEQGNVMKRHTEWGLFIGCMVETKSGEFVPLNTYRATEEKY